MKKLMKKVLGVTLTAAMVFQMPIGEGLQNWQKDTVKTEAASINTTRVSVHDPSVVEANGKYYIFGTHMNNAVSTDLQNWSSFTTNVNSDYAKIFASGASWSRRGGGSYNLADNLWAPDVIYNPTMRKWCMYMSVNGNNYYSSIALATADSITGPYTYQGTICYSGFRNATDASHTDYKRVTGTNEVASRYLSNGRWNSAYGVNAIDPCVIYDANGDLWMSYGSWFGGIYMLKLDKKTGLRDYSYKYSTSANSSDQYFGKKISGGYGKTGEGSYIVYDKSAGYYYLYMSYCGLDATDSFSGYHMRLFRSKNITGPYTDAAGNSAICTSSRDNQATKGIKLMGNYALTSLNGVNGMELSANGYMSGGHNSALVASNGQRYVIYHTRFNTGHEGHQVRVHQQFLNADGWPVTAVYENLGSKISNNYSAGDIVGTYDMVNHGNDATTQYTGMLNTVKVSLNSNGTITGGANGTWRKTAGTYYATMVIDGVTYKGVFFKQYDESASHINTMTFSLIGNNDQAVWGSKTSNSTIGNGKSKGNLDGTYYIKSVGTGKYLDVSNASPSDGANVQQWSFNGCNAQQFKLVSDGNGYYSILTGSSDFKSGLDVNMGSTLNGSNIAQWNHWGGEMQKFEIVEISSGKYAIKTKASASTACLDVFNMSGDNGANINQWTYWGGDCQLWYLERAKDPLEGTYYIKNKNSGMYLDVTKGSAENGANIQQWGFNGCFAQKFKIVSDGAGYYYILTGASKYKSCVDIESGKGTDGTNVIQWTYWGGDMQKYEIVKVGNYYAFKSKASGCKSCLDVYNWSKSNGGNINQWNYWGGDCQLWSLEATAE